MESDGQVHVSAGKVRFEIDGGGEEMECGGILSRAEVNQTQIEGYHPFEGGKI